MAEQVRQKLVRPLRALDLVDLGAADAAVMNLDEDLTERQRTERRLHELQDGLLHVSRVRSMGQMAAALALRDPEQRITAVTVARSNLAAAIEKPLNLEAINRLDTQLGLRDAPSARNALVATR